MPKRDSLTNMRVYSKENELFKKYCKDLGLSSPKLFRKILTSDKVQIEQRILEEVKRKNEDVLRKYNNGFNFKKKK